MGESGEGGGGGGEEGGDEMGLTYGPRKIHLLTIHDHV